MSISMSSRGRLVRRAMQSGFAFALPLLAACTPADEGGEGSGGPVLYHDPQGRFSLSVPAGMGAEPIGDGTHVIFRSLAADTIVLEAEILPLDREAEEWVPFELQQGDPFMAHALWRAQAWCAADGPNQTQSCPEIGERDEELLGNGERQAIRFEAILHREQFVPRQESQAPAGPIWAVRLSGTGSDGEALMLAPAARALASAEDQAVQESIVRSLVAPARLRP